LAVIKNESKKQRTETMNRGSKEMQKKEIERFVFVMIVFTIGMAVLLLYNVSAWWVWYIYFAVWTLVEYTIAKNINLK
jgi:hypothetical protein